MFYPPPPTSMKHYTFFIWQPYLCPHTIPWAEGLIKDERVKDVFYIVPEKNIEERVNLGWNTDEFIEDNSVKYILDPDDKKLQEIYATDTGNAIHVYHGLVCFKKMDHYYKFGLKYNIRRWLTQEPPYVYKKPLWMHFINFYIRDYRYYKYIEKVFAIGELSVYYYKNVFPKKEVIPFFYSTKKPVEIKEPVYRFTNKVNMVFVGNLCHRKNVSFLLNEMQGLSAEAFNLDIIGNGEELELLKKKAQYLKINEMVNFRGALPLSRVYMELFNYDVLLLPSIHDGWGAVVNEALMRGLYVLCSDHCGAKCLCIEPNNGNVFPLKHNRLRKMLLDIQKNMGLIREGRSARIEWSHRIEGESAAKIMLDSIDKN